MLFTCTHRPALGPGEMGAGVVLKGQEAEEGRASMKKWFMNVVARYVKQGMCKR